MNLTKSQAKNVFKKCVLIIVGSDIYIAAKLTKIL